MVDRPIIFSAPMVRALLDGRKTQTRRVLKPHHWNDAGAVVDISCAKSASYIRGSDGRMYFQFEHPRSGPLTALASRFNVGDRMWVREAWAHDEGPVPYRGVQIYYRADVDLSDNKTVRHRPSIHMPRWASRLTLIVDGVKVERLQDISEADALSECAILEYGEGANISERRAFELIWKHLHGEDAWNKNSWVAAISFHAIRANIDKIDADARPAQMEAANG